MAAGRTDEADRLRKVMEAQTGLGGLLPEQIWDTADIPARGLVNGHPAGSAMPLVWAHAEYIKLLRSLKGERVFDLPPQTVQRYQIEQVGSSHVLWRFTQKCRSLPAGKVLRVETLAPARIHWSADGWTTIQDTEARDTGLGLHIVDLLTAQLSRGTEIAFTFYWLQANRWEGWNFSLEISA